MPPTLCLSRRVHKFSMPKFAKGNNSKVFVFKFSPGYLLSIFYQLTKFEATCCNSFRDFFTISFQCQNLQRAITRIFFFFKFSPGYLLSIFYQLTKFEAICCNSFRDFLTISFQCQNLQRAITRKKCKKHFFKFSPGYPLSIFYQLTKFEATCCNSF